MLELPKKHRSLLWVGLTGMINQIAIYESALSKDEIKKISSQGTEVAASGKLGLLWGQIKISIQDEYTR